MGKTDVASTQPACNKWTCIHLMQRYLFHGSYLITFRAREHSLENFWRLRTRVLWYVYIHWKTPPPEPLKIPSEPLKRDMEPLKRGMEPLKTPEPLFHFSGSDSLEDQVMPRPKKAPAVPTPDMSAVNSILAKARSIVANTSAGKRKDDGKLEAPPPSTKAKPSTEAGHPVAEPKPVTTPTTPSLDTTASSKALPNAPPRHLPVKLLSCLPLWGCVGKHLSPQESLLILSSSPKQVEHHQQSPRRLETQTTPQQQPAPLRGHDSTCCRQRKQRPQ